MSQVKKWGRKMASKIYTISRVFAEDHWGRECGKSDVVIRGNKRTVRVLLDDDGYSDMLSDAEYYYDCRADFEEGYKDVIQSARRVMNTLKKVGPPVGEVPDKKLFKDFGAWVAETDPDAFRRWKEIR